MKVILLLCFFLPFCACAQSSKEKAKDDLSGIYNQAIYDFIEAANKNNKKAFDTLYFGKRHNGQETDFPDIQLPQKIGNTVIYLISPDAGEKSQKNHPSRTYVNLIGWTNEKNAEFIFVVFTNGFAHQYDYQLYYDYNKSLQKFELKRTLHIPLELRKNIKE